MQEMILWELLLRDGDYDRIENIFQRRSDVIFSIDVKDKRTGNTPLIWAAKRGHAKIVQLLLKHGADVTLRNYEGQTAVEIASPAIKTILLDSIDGATEASHRLLLQAAWQGNIKVIKKLLGENKVKDINCLNADGLTPLLLVTRDILLFEKLSIQLNRTYSPVEVVDELLSHRADVHALDGDGKSCLHHASNSRAQIAKNIVQAIISGGPDMDCRDKRCFMPIHCASLSGNVQCIVALLEGGSNVNSRGFAGSTPLHITAYNNHDRATCVLLENGADVTLTDDRGLTALDFAKSKKIRNILKVAWEEAANNRKSTTSLGPVRAPSREDTRLSIEERKRKGEVIFDGIPDNPFPSARGDGKNKNGNRLTRHLSLQEKADIAEETMIKDIENGNFTPSPYVKNGVRRLGLVRGQHNKPTPLPRTSSRSMERLPAISPDRNRQSPLSFNHKSDSPIPYGKQAKGATPGSDKGRRASPLTVMETSLPITTVGEDFDNRMTPGPSPTPSRHSNRNHRRAGSDPASGSPNIGDIAGACDPYLIKRGQGVKSGQSLFIPAFITQNHSGLDPSFSECGFENAKVNSPELDDAYGNKPEQLKLAFENPTELLRSRSLLKEEFVLEESRPKDPFMHSSGSDTFSSSSSSHGSTPRETVNQSRLNTQRQSQITSQTKLNSQNRASVQTSKSTTGGRRCIGIQKHSSALKTASPGTAASTSERVPSSMEKLSCKPMVNKMGIVPSRGVDKLKEHKLDVITVHSNLLDDNLTSDTCARNIKDTQNRPVDKHTAQQKTETNDKNKSSKIAPNSSVNVPLQSNSDKSSITQKASKDPLHVTPTKLITNVTAAPSSSINISSASSKMQTSSVPTSDKLSESSNTPAASQAGNSTKDICPNVGTSALAQERNTSRQNSSNSGLQAGSMPSATSSKTGVDNSSVVKQNVANHSDGIKNILGKSKGIKNPEVSKTGSQSQFIQSGNKIVNQSMNAENVEGSKSVGHVKQLSKVFEQKMKNASGEISKVSHSNIAKSDNPSEVEVVKYAFNSSEIPIQNICNLNSSARNISVVEGTDLQASLGVSKSASLQKSYNMNSTTMSAGTKHNNPKAKSVSPPQMEISLAQGRNTLISPMTSAVTRLDVKRDKSSALSASQKKSSEKEADPIRISSSRKEGPGVPRSASMSTIQDSKLKDSAKDMDVNPQTSRMSSSDGAKDINAAVAASTNDDDSPRQFKYKPASAGKPPLVEIVPDGTPRIRRPRQEEVHPTITTPVIVNPFEEFEHYRESEIHQTHGLKGKGIPATQFGFVVEKPITERSKTQPSLKQRNIKSAKKSVPGKDRKPKSAGPSRQKSAKGRRRGARSKEISTEDAVARPKSNKKGRRKKNLSSPDSFLSKQAEQSDVAIISGIGWHVATSCIDKSDAVVVRALDSSDSSDEESSVLSSSRRPSQNTLHLQIIKAGDSSSAVSSPRFLEVRGNTDGQTGLPIMEDDGFQPMNLDMTKNTAANFHKHMEIPPNQDSTYRSELVAKDINNILAFLKEEQGQMNEEMDEENFVSPLGTDEHTAALLKEILVRKLTPIPESPSATHTSTQFGLIPKTIAAIRNFEASVKEEDLNKLLGITPRGTESSHLSESLQCAKNIVNSKSNSQVYNTQNHIAKSRTNSVQSSGTIKKFPQSPVQSSGKEKGKVQRQNLGVKKSESELSLLQEPSEDLKKADKKEDGPHTSRNEAPRSGSNCARKSTSGDRSSTRSHDSRNPSAEDKNRNPQQFELQAEETKHSQTASEVKSSLENMTGNQCDLISVQATTNETGTLQSNESQSSLRRSTSLKRKREVSKRHSTTNILSQTEPSTNIENEKLSSDQATCTSSEPTSKPKQGHDFPKLLSEPEKEHKKENLDDEDFTGKKTPRRERKFSETKVEETEEDLDNVVDEILNSTFPSSSLILKARQESPARALSSTLPEIDRNVLLRLNKRQETSPFHAKSSTVRVSESYEECGPIQETNPDFLKVIHAEKFDLGHKVKAMMNAGASESKVKAMMAADTEAKQLLKIMHSFKQMELYAGPGLGSSKGSRKKTPRKDLSQQVQELQESSSSNHKPPSGRPSSAGTGSRMKSGRFTEIKDSQSRPTPQDIGIKHKGDFLTPKPESMQESEQFEELAAAIRATTPDNETVYSCIDSFGRAGSACTSVSSTHSVIEETIQWKKGNILGKGAFGIVWCGLTSEGQLIAVKQIELNTTSKEKAKKEYEKVQEEVELLKTLNHKNIVGYLGTSLDEGESVVNIFMQFVPGGSIASILARFGALDEAVFRRYTKQMLDGVEYLHVNDVIHRDIKGGNVMLMPNGIIKLIDFGCAKRLCINLSMGQSQILKSMKGTPYWMAPEVVNESGHGKKSDIWSIGCTVFEMATRKPPWADMNPMAAIFAIGSDKPIPQLPEKFSHEARDFVNTCLTRNQSFRPTATELHQHPFIKRRSTKK
ncbi:hypothetical protein CHS0354_013848 [Potamilus streckersoni]|uniref:Mitogen-activated protein kinase kinase kinase 19 n=1 Tax=Potamilus streckersoni TaxID=2493646 RepID=A0AAE0VWG6_9BIVA|nr:hypothetical protein CHS0354_013848 [Potamilus streckersoni]